MADAVLRPLVARGLGPNLAQLQATTDGASTPGAGPAAARAMTGGAAVDASTSGGLMPDSAAKYSKFPPILSSLIDRSVRGGPASAE